MPGQPTFEWDDAKDRLNRAKHGVSFALAQEAFFDPRCVIAEDLQHSSREKRFYCFGEVAGGVMTVQLHAARRAHPDFRRRLLAERKDDL